MGGGGERRKSHLAFREKDKNFSGRKEPPLTNLTARGGKNLPRREKLRPSKGFAPKEKRKGGKRPLPWCGGGLSLGRRGEKGCSPLEEGEMGNRGGRCNPAEGERKKANVLPESRGRKLIQGRTVPRRKKKDRCLFAKKKKKNWVLGKKKDDYFTRKKTKEKSTAHGKKKGGGTLKNLRERENWGGGGRHPNSGALRERGKGMTTFFFVKGGTPP